MSKDSRADRRFNAIKKKYNVGRPGGVLASYDKLPYFKIHRFILNADEKRITLPDGTDTYLKMHDVGLYFILNMLAKEDGVNNKSHLVMLNSEDVKNIIKNMLEKSQTDTHSSKIIRESFEKLAAIKLIDCDIQEKNKSKVYQNISIPHEHEKYKAKGYFKFYYVDIIRAIEKINSDSMKTACKDSCDSDYEDAKYVPDNSVANKKVKGNFTPKMNESCDEWGSCGLPSDNNAGVSKDKPDVMGESSDDIVGQDDSMDDSDEMYNDDVMSDDEFDRLLNDSGIEINDSDNSEYSDDDIDQTNYEDNSQDYEDYEGYEDNGDYEGNDDYDDELEYSDDSSNDQAFESRKRNLIDSIVESVTSKILRKRGNGIGILPNGWFNNDERDLSPFYSRYSNLVSCLKDIKSLDDPDEVNSLYEKTETDYLKLKHMINALSNGGKLNMRPEVYERFKEAIDSASPDDINTLLHSIDDIWEQIGNVWDNKYAKEADKDFGINNDKWNYHKVNDLGYDSYDPNDLDALERRDDSYRMESRKHGIQEDKTVLHDFGKHPGYRKKPMTLPSNDEDAKDGYKDWNDDSVKSDKPFGMKIGSSAPFDEKVKMITDAIMDQLKENFSKKKS